jgi:uncharacterized membrane protein
MDNTHLHLLLNHFPIIGTMIGTVILLFGFWKSNHQLQQVALTLLVIMALFAIPVFLTGEPADETVENLPGVSEAMLEEHEEAGEWAFWIMIAAGAASLISLVLLSTESQSARLVMRVTLVLSLLASTAMARTGYLGGQIRHSEIRIGGADSVQSGSGQDSVHENDD